MGHFVSIADLLHFITVKIIYTYSFRRDYFTGKSYFTVRKRALWYIHSHTVYVGFPVRVGAKL